MAGTECGQVAQVVERSPEKAGVGGSTPSLATIISITYKQLGRFRVAQKATLADHKLTKGAGAFASDSSACTATKELVDFHARGKAPFSWALMRSEITMGAKYIGSGENRSSAVHLEDLAELYCQALKNAQSSCVIHAAGENVSTKEVALSIHRAMKFKGDPKSISPEEARRQPR